MEVFGSWPDSPRPELSYGSGVEIETIGEEGAPKMEQIGKEHLLKESLADAMLEAALGGCASGGGVGVKSGESTAVPAVAAAADTLDFPTSAAQESSGGGSSRDASGEFFIASEDFVSDLLLDDEIKAPKDVRALNDAEDSKPSQDAQAPKDVKDGGGGKAPKDVKDAEESEAAKEVQSDAGNDGKDRKPAFAWNRFAPREMEKEKENDKSEDAPEMMQEVAPEAAALESAPESSEEPLVGTSEEEFLTSGEEPPSSGAASSAESATKETPGDSAAETGVVADDGAAAAGKGGDAGASDAPFVTAGKKKGKKKKK